jgi:hypothetical protein
VSGWKYSSKCHTSRGWSPQFSAKCDNYQDSTLCSSLFGFVHQKQTSPSRSLVKGKCIMSLFKCTRMLFLDSDGVLASRQRRLSVFLKTIEIDGLLFIWIVQDSRELKFTFPGFKNNGKWDFPGKFKTPCWKSLVSVCCCHASHY